MRTALRHRPCYDPICGDQNARCYKMTRITLQLLPNADYINSALHNWHIRVWKGTLNARQDDQRKMEAPLPGPQLRSRGTHRRALPAPLSADPPSRTPHPRARVRSPPGQVQSRRLRPGRNRPRTLLPPLPASPPLWTPHPRARAHLRSHQVPGGHMPGTARSTRILQKALHAEILFTTPIRAFRRGGGSRLRKVSLPIHYGAI